MKTFRLTLIIALLASILYLDLSATTVDEQITAIVNATPDTRVELVNEFKQTLAIMSSDDRASAIAQMRSNMSLNKTQKRAQEHVNQVAQSGDMQRTQQKNQQKAGSQAMQQHNGVTGTQTGIPNKFMGKK